VAENAANDHENIIQLAQKINKKSLGEGKTKRERIDHIDFDNPLGRVEKAAPEIKTAIRDVVPQVHPFNCLANLIRLLYHLWLPLLSSMKNHLSKYQSSNHQIHLMWKTNLMFAAVLLFPHLEVRFQKLLL
jgi:hypothetical protein